MSVYHLKIYPGQLCAIRGKMKYFKYAPSKTQMCEYGETCTESSCALAHNEKQLMVLSPRQIELFTAHEKADRALEERWALMKQAQRNTDILWKKYNQQRLEVAKLTSAVGRAEGVVRRLNEAIRESLKQK